MNRENFITSRWIKGRIKGRYMVINRESGKSEPAHPPLHCCHVPSYHLLLLSPITCHDPLLYCYHPLVGLPNQWMYCLCFLLFFSFRTHCLFNPLCLAMTHYLVPSFHSICCHDALFLDHGPVLFGNQILLYIPAILYCIKTNHSCITNLRLVLVLPRPNFVLLQPNFVSLRLISVLSQPKFP